MNYFRCRIFNDTITRIVTSTWLLAILLFTNAADVVGQTEQPSSYVPWCGTPIPGAEERARVGGVGASPDATCGPYFAYDDPAVRDVYIPGDNPPIITLALGFHICAYADGSTPVTTESAVADCVEDLNRFFLPAGVQFVYTVDFINSDRYRHLAESDIVNLKLATSIDNPWRLNIWVVRSADFTYSMGSGPVSAEALQPRGGIIMNIDNWGWEYGVVAHEIGHCVGLYHTFFGWETSQPCDGCWEPVGTPDGDLLGDRCSDTPPQPWWPNCFDATTNDPCSGLPWGSTQPENIMSYAPEGCLAMLTPQQYSRTLAALDIYLSDWVVDVRFDADCLFGGAPFEVNFSGFTSHEVVAWHWDFGDGTTSDTQSPTHTFTSPGSYSVSCGVETMAGTFIETQAEMILVHADTLAVLDADLEQGEQVRVDLSLANGFDLAGIRIPIQWSSENDMDLDSISTSGLRTEFFEVAVVSIENANRRATLVLQSTVSGQPPYLPTGSGAVASLHFTADSPGADSTTVQVLPYGPYTADCYSAYGAYTPDLVTGYVYGVECCAHHVGDANGLGGDEPTIGDVSIMIDAKFLTGACLNIIECLTEADVNQSGGPEPTCDDVTIGDISILIDYLFITGPSINLLECL